MKSDARFLLNKKKRQSASNTWWNRDMKSHGTMDARKILNLKRSQKVKAPMLGSYMRTKTASALIASQIRKEIVPEKMPDKRVHLSSDGNLIITSKSKKFPQISKGNEMPSFKRPLVKPSQSMMQWESSLNDTDDLEYTVLEDLIDMDSLPPTYIPPKAIQSTNLSRRRSRLDDVLEMKNTMVADQLSESQAETTGARIYVSNLHPSVSLTDVMELFGDVGIITNVEMVRPGTALIHFYDGAEAEKACDTYHNRLLDGQPMKCYLQVNPKPGKTSISQRLGNRIISPPAPKVVSKPAAANPMSRYNPRNVQFTVKLT